MYIRALWTHAEYATAGQDYHKRKRIRRTRDTTLWARRPPKPVKPASRACAAGFMPCDGTINARRFFSVNCT